MPRRDSRAFSTVSSTWSPLRRRFSHNWKFTSGIEALSPKVTEWVRPISIGSEEEDVLSVVSGIYGVTCPGCSATNWLI